MGETPTRKRQGFQEYDEKLLVRASISALLLNDTERERPYDDSGLQGGYLGLR